MTQISSVSRLRSARIFWKPGPFRNPATVMKQTTRRHRRRVGCSDAAAEHLPCRPSPEIHIEVAQVLGMRTGAPLDRRYPIAQRHDALRRTVLDPAAQP